MVRVINGNILSRCLSEEMKHKLDSFGIGHYREQCGENIIEMRKGQLNIEVTDSPYHYENTCFLMGADYLSNVLSQCIVYKAHAFNVLLMDQV